LGRNGPPLWRVRRRDWRVGDPFGALNRCSGLKKGDALMLRRRRLDYGGTSSLRVGKPEKKEV